MKIVEHEKRNVLGPNKGRPAVMIKPSIIRMTIPMFKEKAFDSSWASKSVPPVLVSYLSIRPIPVPIHTPPKITLGKTES